MLISLTSVLLNLLSPPKPPSHTKKLKSKKMTRPFRFLVYTTPPMFRTDYTSFSHRQDDLTSSIRMLNILAQKLKAKRMAAGALNLASPEVKIHLDSSESSDPIDVEQKEMRETNSLVEEFMLLANISVARKIEETFPQTAVLRWIFCFTCLLETYWC